MSTMKNLINRQQVERETDWINWSEGLPSEVMADARHEWEGLLNTQFMDLRHAVLRLLQAAVHLRVKR